MRKGKPLFGPRMKEQERRDTMNQSARRLRTPKYQGEPADNLDINLQPPTLKFPTREVYVPTFNEHIVYLKDRQEKNRSAEKSSEFARIEIESETPIGIVLSSDWHIGSEGTDYDLFEKHMKMVKEEPNAYLTALSNTIDGYIWPGGMWSEIAHIPEQMEIARQFAREYKDKLIAVVGSRCHDWTKDKGGVSPQEMAFMENVDEGMPFFTHGGVLTVGLNGRDTTFALIHKSRYHSSLNVTNPNKRIHDLRWPADIIAIAHHHVASVEDTYRWEGPFKKEVALVRTGTYKLDDGYSQDEGFGHGQNGSPMVILSPDRKDYMVFKKLEHGMTVLKALKKDPTAWKSAA